MVCPCSSAFGAVLGVSALTSALNGSAAAAPGTGPSAAAGGHANPFGAVMLIVGWKKGIIIAGENTGAPGTDGVAFAFAFDVSPGAPCCPVCLAAAAIAFTTLANGPHIAAWFCAAGQVAAVGAPGTRARPPNAAATPLTKGGGAAAGAGALAVVKGYGTYGFSV